MIVVNLNIRGVGGSSKARYLRHIIACEGAVFVCLQETKAKAFSAAKCYSLWGDNKVGWLHNEGDNGRGSLLSMWYEEAFRYESHVSGKGFIAVFGNHIKTNISCVIVNVYAACSLEEKKIQWEELSNVKAASQALVWCFCGDFNAIRNRNERKGVREGISQSGEIRGFNNFIDSNSLLELPVVGKPFTWFKSNGSAKSRLDRVLVSEEWMESWPMCKQYVQRREVSDHCALVVKAVEKDWGPKPFRSIDAWFMEKGFREMVKNYWSSYSVQGSAFIKFKEKLKALKGDLKVWNRDVFGNLHTSKKRILQDLEALDCLDCSNDLGEYDRLKRVELVGRLKETERKLDSLTCQKARAKWLKDGDLCTRFFHSSLRWRRLRNEVKGVEVGGIWCEEPGTVRQEAKNLFQNRFSATKDFGVRLDMVEFMALSSEDNVYLTAAFGEKELREAVWLCDGTKSPGPDGFNLNFIKESWDILKDDIVAAAANFYDNGFIPKGCNASFVALIPKVKDPVTLEQYRPISLVGALYKILAKVLAGRIKNVLSSVIDECQSAFLKNRGILDSVLLANEVVEDLRREGKSGLCLKVDFEKAYDSVRWEFLYDMLNRMGFDSRWVMWIKGCLESATVSVLVNGSPTEEFKPTRGLRQGDPLAPFLFIVVAEGLAGLVRQGVKSNILSGLKIGRKEVELSILQFADDTLFLCQDSFSNIITLKSILRGYELASGLKINFHKSKLAGVNVMKSNLDCYSKALNCGQMMVPFSYLGLEVGGNPRKKKFWEPVINKLKSRLSVWRGRFLSMAGRLCLINSVLCATPLYYLSLFKAPEVVCKSIISIQRRFLWGWGKEKKPISWISWKDLCKNKDEGGLGIKDIRKFNYALMAKWKWRISSNDKGRWKEVLESKYGLGTDEMVPIKYQSLWWRDLTRVCREGGDEGWFQGEVVWKVGSGDKVRFWEDVWVGSSNLKAVYPRLFSLSLNQGHKVEEVGGWEGSMWRWSLSWRRVRFE